VTITTEDMLRRYPRLVAHLVCESLGYFSPDAAANAIIHAKRWEPFACEWYMYMAGADRSLVEIGRQTLERAVRGRHGHRGYMAEYRHALALVHWRVRTGRGPLLASWM
jgi:hypothetical protein